MIKPKAIILAGGIGKRMWPIKTNKLLLPFLGRPLIFHTLEAIKKAGIGDLVVVGRPAIISQLEKMVGFPDIQVVLQPKPTGLGEAVIKGLKGDFVLKGLKKAKKSQPILVINANDIFDPDLIKQIIRTGEEGKSEIIIPGLRVKEYFPGGYLKIKKGQLEKVVEKPLPGKEPTNLVKLVVDYFKNSDDLLKILPQILDRPDSYEMAINQLAKSGVKIRVVRYKGFWGSIKYPWDILRAMNLFFKHRFPKQKGQKPLVSGPVTVTGPVVFEEGVKILEGAKVRGPAYIGAGTIIGNQALVRESIIGKNCVVGYGTEIARSYVGDNCWFHTNYVGDSVLEENVSLGAGTVLANLRFDEQKVKSLAGKQKINTNLEKLGAIIGRNAKVGVNASVMPGVKIGTNSLVGPGAVLEKDLPENKFCYLKQSLKTRKNKKLFSLKNQLRQKARKKI
ncbi:MAG TPA: sugar phosphate nucleotidyltransferase [Candidatus Bathyarchaeia archaeon]|nr:sugar phosphate nucleotidyltransferase [Candidatus Bathyarchaeia archaeon]